MAAFMPGLKIISKNTYRLLWFSLPHGREIMPPCLDKMNEQNFEIVGCFLSFEQIHFSSTKHGKQDVARNPETARNIAAMRNPL